MKTRQICMIKKKFKKITAAVISNKLNHKTKIKKVKYTDIRDLLENFNKNTIGETDAKIKLNALNKLKNAEIKNKRCSSNKKELLKLFADLLKNISNNNTNSNNNDNESESDNGNESESDNENDNDNVNESESESQDESEDKNEEYYKIKKSNGYFKMIDETKSFEKQINLLKKKEYFIGILVHQIL